MADLSKGLDLATKSISKMTASVTKLNPVIGGLQAGVEVFGAALDRANAYAQKNIEVNERLLLLGTDRVQFLTENIDALRDNTGSLDDNLRVATEMRALGLSQFRDQQTSLAASMKMTGQNTKAALQLFTTLETNTTLTIGAQERIAASIETTADTFGRTAESIVNVLKKLNTTFLEKAGADTEGITTAITKLAGPDLLAAEKITGILNMLETRDAGMMAMVARTGRMDEARQVLTDPTEQALRSFIEGMADEFDTRFGGNEDVFTKQVQIGALGQAGEMLFQARLARDLMDRPKDAVDPGGIQETLAADKVRAQKQSELNMATVTGFRRLEQLGIAANGFLDTLATSLVKKTDDLVNKNEASRQLNQSIKDEIEAQTDIAQTQADIAQQERLDRIQNTAMTISDIARLTGFDVGTVTLESFEMLHRDNERIVGVLESLDGSTKEEARRALFKL